MLWHRHILRHCVRVVKENPDGTIAHLLAWEVLELDGSWQAWVSWVQQVGDRPIH
jgi:hypothetical protein